MGILVENPGFLTTIQDLGRIGYGKYGMPQSGAMDVFSFKLANILVGNPENAASLEITLMGPELLFTEDNIVAITGGNLSPRVNYINIPMNKAIFIKKGDILSFGSVQHGCRSYISFAGGFSNIKSIMNSYATYLKGKVGGYEGRKLLSKDFIEFKSPMVMLKNFFYREYTVSNNSTLPLEIRVVLGPQEGDFTKDGIKTFLNSTYIVSKDCDRMGYRLEGTPIEHLLDGNIISDGIAFGAIQVPPHGQPIIMMADRQTIGGYPKIANVISVDIPKIAQSKPGDQITC